MGQPGEPGAVAPPAGESPGDRAENLRAESQRTAQRVTSAVTPALGE